MRPLSISKKLSRRGETKQIPSLTPHLPSCSACTHVYRCSGHLKEPTCCSLPVLWTQDEWARMSCEVGPKSLSLFPPAPSSAIQIPWTHKPWQLCTVCWGWKTRCLQQSLGQSRDLLDGLCLKLGDLVD